MTYTFAIQNTGNVTLYNVGVTDAQAPPSLGSSLGPITCTTGTNGSITLWPQATDSCSATYTVTPADMDNGSITDTAHGEGHPAQLQQAGVRHLDGHGVDDRGRPPSPSRRRPTRPPSRRPARR